jgi:SPX domain protein involved in polyphosphate accumulation
VAAYLDYDRLKEILKEMEATASANNSLSVCDDTQSPSSSPNNNICALRFDAYSYFCEASRQLFQGVALFKNLVSNNMSSSPSSSSLLSSSSSEEDKWNVYSFVGLELLHLLRFICVNAVGIRKIPTRHDKMLQRLQRNDNEIIDMDHNHMPLPKTATTTLKGV